jgi:transcriptional regulator with XRE-family HTH domain
MDGYQDDVGEMLARLKAARKRLGWSEETCAHDLGVTYSTLNRWERGESLPKSRAVLRAIEQFLARHEPRHDTGTSTAEAQGGGA